MEANEKNMQLFMYLAGSFEMSAMMAMGKIKNPMTDKTERDLTQAQFSIDILDMIKEKTKGNLSDYEQKYIENILGQLKLNYIDEVNKDKDKPETEKITDPEKSEETSEKQEKESEEKKEEKPEENKSGEEKK